MMTCFISDLRRNGRYIDSEWCQNGAEHPVKGRIIAACDAYEYKKDFYMKNLDQHHNISCYLKFCINKNGDLVFMASCHT